MEEQFALSAALAGASIAVSHGWSLQNQFGLASDRQGVTTDLLSPGAFASPYLALADGGDGLSLDQQLSDRWSVRAGLARRDRGVHDLYGSSDTTVMLAEVVGVGGRPPAAQSFSSASSTSRIACSTPAAAGRSVCPAARRRPFSASPVAPS